MLLSLSYKDDIFHIGNFSPAFRNRKEVTVLSSTCCFQVPFIFMSEAGFVGIFRYLSLDGCRLHFIQASAQTPS